MPGVGAMLHMLRGGSTEPPEKYYGRRIVGAKVTDELLELRFEDGVIIHLTDEGQSCCEHRYITCDDNVDDLIGQTLREITTKDGPDLDHGDEVHETVFVEIATDLGSITITTHNEHNGYYGGFALNIKEQSPHQFTVAAFYQFARQQSGPYNWYEPDDCPIGCYARSLGLSYHEFVLGSTATAISTRKIEEQALRVGAERAERLGWPNMPKLWRANWDRLFFWEDLTATIKEEYNL